MDMIDRLVLSIDPWPGEEGSIVVTRDEFVTTRKPHVCVVCSSVVPVKSRVRCRAEIDRESRMAKNFYFCTVCCDAMKIAAETGDMDVWFNRWPSVSP